jgi:hypothetical protein
VELELLRALVRAVALAHCHRHHEAVALDPGDWLPWSYEATLADLRSGAPPPP